MLPPLSLYVHFPWCIQKCPYCDFNSHTLKGDMPDTQYLHQLIHHLDENKPFFQSRPLQSIFLGGGTPSIFPFQTLEKFFNHLYKNFTISPNAEITMEVNPGTSEYTDFNDYHSLGINRISLGAQSFQDFQLQKLGRIHKSKEIFKCVEKLHASKINNFNIDLMYALPQQTVSDALYDLHQAVNLSPNHISWYQLTLEPHTAFYHSPPKHLPDEDSSYAIEQAGLNFLKQHDFKRYEISAYAREDKMSQHNLNYWMFGDYIGIGAGAHGKLTQTTPTNPSDLTIVRTTSTKHPKLYNQIKNTQTFQNIQSIKDTQMLIHEFMLNALRLVDGFSTRTFEAHTYISIQTQTLQTQLNQAIQNNLLTYDAHSNHYQPTALGLNFLNDLIGIFQP